MDNKSYYDSSQGGFGFGGGGAIWIFLLAFLFMFRGGHGEGYGRDGGRRDYEDGRDRYTRYDADFREQRSEGYFTKYEAQKERYEGMLRAEKCCCETNQHILGVKCEVKDQGMETRAQALDLYNRGLIERKDAEIAMLAAYKNRKETVDEILGALRCGHNHGLGFGGYGGFIPAPAGHYYHGYTVDRNERRGCCPAEVV